MHVFSSLFISISLCWIFSTFSAFGQSQEIPEYASILSKYIQIRSESRQEKEAGEFFLNECKRKGLKTEILIGEDTAFNFVASIYPLSSNKPNIIFLNHIDVVPPCDAAHWKYPPYDGVINDSVVWGRGAIDNKGMAVAQLFAVAHFVELAKKTELPFNVSILSVAGEETDGFTGAKPVSEKFMDKLHAIVMLGEGGSGVRGIIKSDPDKIVFGVSTTEKISLTLDLTMKLQSSGHGSVPPDEYAMKEMVIALEELLTMKPCIKYSNISAKGLKELGRHEKGIPGFVQRNLTFLFFRKIVKREIKKDPLLTSLFAHTIALTKINVPQSPSHNQITQEVTATLDCRLMPGTNPERFIKNMHHWLKDDRIVIHQKYQIKTAPPTEHPEYLKLISESIKAVYPESIFLEIIFPATTDNNFFRAKGVPVFGIFPACFQAEELAGIHNVNEKIHFERIQSSILVYTRFLENILKPSMPDISSLDKKY